MSVLGRSSFKKRRLNRVVSRPRPLYEMSQVLVTGLFHTGSMQPFWDVMDQLQYGENHEPLALDKDISAGADGAADR